MAAPTNVRVYATSQTSAVLKWTYGGAAAISIHRSVNGTDYTNIDYVSPSVLTYTDDSLSAGTKYWYKLSDDNGNTFSSVVTVFSHTCLSPAGSDDVLALPRTGGKTPEEEFDELAERIESALNGRLLNPEQCAACPSDGAVVIDCSGGCHDWVVIADNNINSISVEWCGEGDGNIEFIIPPNTTVGICGFPDGFGFSGDECTQAPISGGTNGRSINVGMGNKARANPSSTRSRPGYGAGIGTGGGGGSSCNCVPTSNGGLTIKSCNANNSLNCTSTKSLKLIACGGKGPYSWSRTGSINLKGQNQAAGSTAAGAVIIVTPPTNSGSGEAGNAYLVRHYICSSAQCSGVTCGNVQAESEAVYGCSDNFIQCQAVSGGATPSDAAVGAVCCPEIGEERCPSNTCPDFGDGVNVIADVRTAGMISAGCSPCGLNNGATVTVTDSVGTETTIILTT